MKKTWRRNLFLGGTVLLGAMALSGTTALADVTMNITAIVTSSVVETVTTEMDFGTIEVLPGGDTIIIDASGGGGGAGGAAATPVAVGASAVTGGSSGLITIASAIGFNIDVVYEADSVVVIADDTNTTSTFLNAIDTYSGGGTTDGTVTHTAGIDTLIHVGGEIAFPAGSITGNYSGSTNIIINYS